MLYWTTNPYTWMYLVWPETCPNVARRETTATSPMPRRTATGDRSISASYYKKQKDKERQTRRS